MKKFISLFAAIIVSLSIVACGNTNKPDDTVAKFWDALKEFNMEAAVDCMELGDVNTQNDALEGTTENKIVASEQINEYLKTCAKEMDYIIGDYSINNDIAVIPVTVTYIDASPVISAALGDYVQQAFMLALSGADDEVLGNLLTAIFIEKLESVNTGTSTSTIEIKCVKVNNEWKIDTLSDDVDYLISNVLSCNILKTLESFNNNINAEDKSGLQVDDNSQINEEIVWYDVPAGQTLELATVKMTITDCREETKLQAKYFDDAVAQEGTKFVIITVDVENITKSTINFNNEFSLYDSQGREYKDYSDANWYFDETFVYTELSPNIKKTGTLVYNVPIDAQDYYILTGKSGTNEVYCMYTN